MRLFQVIWKYRFVEKIERKHHVTTDEAEEVIFGESVFRRVRRGRVKGEDVYAVLGQTDEGRYLVVFFILKGTAALPISARPMASAERKYYERQR